MNAIWNSATRARSAPDTLLRTHASMIRCQEVSKAMWIAACSDSRLRSPVASLRPEERSSSSSPSSGAARPAPARQEQRRDRPADQRHLVVTP
ncbi:hypothetical protein GWI34_34580 [Actinomadura sp. DSM 109109]|nr:hypothetical protein [Actinomadura lepetitiana]